MKKISIHVPVAYCIELGRVVTIDEAREEYFAKSRSMNEKFHFLCPNEACRRLPKPPEISAVNLYEMEFIRAPYFRRFQKDAIHAHGCILLKYTAIENMIFDLEKRDRPPSDTNFFMRTPRIHGRIVDALVLHQDTTIENSLINVMSNIKNKVNDIKKIVNIPYTTSSLGVVVDQFRAMDKNEKKIFQLKLPDKDTPKHSYRMLFKQVRWAERRQIWQHIYYGLAITYLKDDVFNIEFQEEPTDYEGTGKEKLHVMAFFSRSSLVGTRGMQETLHALDRLAQTHERFCCYILGKSQRQSVAVDGADAKDVVVIENASSKSIVVRETLFHCEYDSSFKTKFRD